MSDPCPAETPAGGERDNVDSPPVRKRRLLILGSTSASPLSEEGLFMDRDWEFVVAGRHADLFRLLQTFQPDLLLIELDGARGRGHEAPASTTAELTGACEVLRSASPAAGHDFHEAAWEAMSGPMYCAIPMRTATISAPSALASFPADTTIRRGDRATPAEMGDGPEVRRMADDWAWIELEEFFG